MAWWPIRRCSAGPGQGSKVRVGVVIPYVSSARGTGRDEEMQGSEVTAKRKFAGDSAREGCAEKAGPLADRGKGL